MTFETSCTIYGGDTDYSGRIYTATVVDKLMESLQKFRATVDYPNARLIETGQYPVARNVDVDYLGEITVDDELLVGLTPDLGTTSVTYGVTGTVDGAEVVGGSVTTVWVDADTGSPIEVPQPYRAEIEGQLDGDVDAAVDE